MKKFLVSLFVAMFAMAPSPSHLQAGGLERIPAETHVIIHVAAPAKLPLQELMDKAPKIPPLFRDKFKEITGKLGFNPLTDVKELWVVVKQGESKKDDRGAVVLLAPLREEKLQSVLKELNLPITSSELQGVKWYTGGDGKNGIAFQPNDLVFIGHQDYIKLLLDAQKGVNDLSANPEFKSIQSRWNKEALAQLTVFNSPKMATNFKKDVERKQEKLKNRPGKLLMHNYMTGGVEPTALVAQLFEDHVEGSLYYKREGKPQEIQANFHLTDPKLRISQILEYISQNIGTLAPEQANEEKDKKEDKKEEEKD